MVRGTHGDRVVDDAIRTLIDDSHALEASRTHERALPMHLLLKAKHFDKYKACIVIGGNLRQRDHDIDILQSVYECNLFACYSVSPISTSSPYEQWTSKQRVFTLP